MHLHLKLVRLADTRQLSGVFPVYPKPIANDTNYVKSCLSSFSRSCLFPKCKSFWKEASPVDTEHKNTVYHKDN